MCREQTTRFSLLWISQQSFYYTARSPALRSTPYLENEVPVFMFQGDRVAQLYPQALGSLFVAFYDSLGDGGSILSRLHNRRLAYCSTLKVKATSSSETSVDFQRTTWNYIPENMQDAIKTNWPVEALTARILNLQGRKSVVNTLRPFHSYIGPGLDVAKKKITPPLSETEPRSSIA
jgi:hypothetical protein